MIDLLGNLVLDGEYKNVMALGSTDGMITLWNIDDWEMIGIYLIQIILIRISQITQIGY